MSTDGEVGYSAVVVTKPELARDITFGAGDDAQHIVVIGDQEWTGQRRRLPAGPRRDGRRVAGGVRPDPVGRRLRDAGAWTGAEDQGTEERNGAQAKHFHIDSETFSGTFAGMPAGASIDAWIAEEGGYLIALEVLNEQGQGFVIDVTDINDPANVVERPS